MDPSHEALLALRGSGPISREDLRRWMNADVETKAIVYVLTDKAWSRIEPELSLSEQCTFMRDYLCECLVAGCSTGETGDYVHSGFEAAWELAAWLKHLAHIEGTSAIIKGVAAKLGEIYVTAEDSLRNRIETGALEHALEEPLLVTFFSTWRNDEQLSPAFSRALAWAVAHPPGP